MNITNIMYNNDFAVDKLSDELKNQLDDDLIICCIGTDRCIADSLAPIVGTLLRENNINIPVYGTIDEPIHALNIETRLKKIKEKHPTSKILGIDACLGDSDNIGEIRLRDCGIRAGKGVGKSLPTVGDISIIGIVDESDSTFHLNNTRLSFIMKMAKTISKSIIKAVNK